MLELFGSMFCFVTRACGIFGERCAPPFLQQPAGHGCEVRIVRFWLWVSTGGPFFLYPTQNEQNNHTLAIQVPPQKPQKVRGDSKATFAPFRVASDRCQEPRFE